MKRLILVRHAWFDSFTGFARKHGQRAVFPSGAVGREGAE
jgi:hypothetical protein